MTPIHEQATGAFRAAATYDPDSKVIIVKNEGLIHEPTATDVWRKAVEFSKNNPTVAILVDSEKLKGTFSKMNNFFKNEVVPAFEKAGVKYTYIGMTTDIFTRFAMNQLLKILSTGIDLKVFSTVKEARELLQQKINSTITM